MRSETDPKKRLVVAAIDLMRMYGLKAASVREVAKHAKAPLGSTYHYFPNGKQEIINEALNLTGNLVLEKLDQALIDGPQKGLQQFIQQWKDILVNSSFRAGCPIMAVLVEAGNEEGSEQHIEHAANIFDLWENSLFHSLTEHHVCHEEAKNLALTIVAAVEGAVLLCRAKRSLVPLETVAQHFESALSKILTTQ
ncbi:MAG: TetR/AcrR family transcriptional regulator [Acinetobacter sp.]|jgi:TetR/AcrR family transcriptional repressor of lmrAB and yxaGH operons|uniref:TetR/AcrR family transcriptional regulator n=1 Tax=Acinetobacter sp. TaxID=472 RepID=UPI000FC171D7|nr:TetR/AcrR family transcriptional regulator [Acinetobacter sp.]RUP36259.1 MAG: TetR/AcrR family transcriptional regulator [Acinetobacter sp.]